MGPDGRLRICQTNDRQPVRCDTPLAAADAAARTGAACHTSAELRAPGQCMPRARMAEVRLGTASNGSVVAGLRSIGRLGPRLDMFGPRSRGWTDGPLVTLRRAKATYRRDCPTIAVDHAVNTVLPKAARHNVRYAPRTSPDAPPRTFTHVHTACYQTRKLKWHVTGQHRSS